MTRLTRSMLFVPAVRWPMIEKAAASAADVVCIDLEDSVPFDQKIPARANVVRAFRELDFGRRARIFRMNALDTQLAARGRWTEVDSPAGRIPALLPPHNLQHAAAAMGAVPVLGQHTDEILKELE